MNEENSKENKAYTLQFTAGITKKKYEMRLEIIYYFTHKVYNEFVAVFC